MFQNNNRLTVHLTRHKQASLTCNICKRSFPLEWELKRHKELVHKTNILKCQYCDAYFGQKKDLNIHLQENHIDELKNKINTAIEQLKQEGKQITYVSVAKLSIIPRNIIRQNKIFSSFFIEENDLRIKYFEISKLPIEERMERQKDIIKEAILTLKQKDNKKTQDSIAKEIGLSRIIFFINPYLRDILV